MVLKKVKMNFKKFSTGFKVSYISFSILAIMAFVLYSVSIISALNICIFSAIMLILASAGILITLFIEFKTTLSFKIKGKLFSKGNLLVFLSVFAGAIITYALSIYVGLGAVIASGLVGVAAAVFIPKYGAPIFCGSFAGMSSALLLSPWELLLAAVLAAVLYVLSQNTLKGFGGKYGTIAFSACVAASILTGSSVPAKNFAGWDTGLILIILSVCAAVLTYTMSNRLKLGSVLASGLVGVLAGVWLPMLFPKTGTTMAVMIFCASFAGMSSPKRIINEFFVAIAGIISGLAFIFSFTLQGAGGKLGTIAFGSIMSVYGFIWIYQKTFMRLKQKTY